MVIIWRLKSCRWSICLCMIGLPILRSWRKSLMCCHILREDLVMILLACLRRSLLGRLWVRPSWCRWLYSLLFFILFVPLWVWSILKSLSSRKYSKYKFLLWFYFSCGKLTSLCPLKVGYIQIILIFWIIFSLRFLCLNVDWW